MKLFAALFFAAVMPVSAQPPQVPHKMEFAGMTLTIRDDAKREIQKDVDAITQSPKHYEIKADRARTYFPIIEKIFQEENVPDDFKYLALQESALIPDAVSTSNAVGFWQFKDFTAIEMGLRVDKEIDERLNIVSSSRAAARYFKKNNTFFENWLYALQAYQMGAGGVMNAVKDTKEGATHMEITSKTYWYVKRFLAHKIAYEPAVKGKGQTELIAYDNKTGKSLSALAKEVSVNETELYSYNKWTKSGSIPADRLYVVMIPVAGEKKDLSLPTAVVTKQPMETRVSSTVSGVAAAPTKRKVNGVMTIHAMEGETSEALASRAGVEMSKFLQWNDLDAGEKLKAGDYYFLGRKRVRATENFHKVEIGESLWSISQRYGVQLRKLRKYNRLSPHTEVSPGTMLWLASTRPKSDNVEAQVQNPVAVSRDDSFNWAATTAESPGQAQDGVTEAVVIVNNPAPIKETTLENDSMQKPSESGEILQESANTASATTDNVVVIPEIPKKTLHTVGAGETLYAIAKVYQISVMDLVNWNNLDLQQGIKPGQVLKLSGSQPAEIDAAAVKPLREVVHEVKSSDTLYSIARQYGVTIKEIMDWNEKKDFSLAVGEKLKIHHRQ